jgi:hypothetical protein
MMTVLPDTPLLGLLMILGIRVLYLANSENMPAPQQEIMSKYRGKGVAGIIPCAAELIKAGYAGNARM